KDTGVGNPYKANKEKGTAYLDACVQAIGGFFNDLGRTPKEKFYLALMQEEISKMDVSTIIRAKV
ncbi:MAG: hypothetical protein P8X78_00765, partial [Nitrosopumilaceae archaeon]